MVGKYNKQKKIKIKTTSDNFDFEKMHFIEKKDYENQVFKAIIYCRVSTNGQIQNGHGIESQEEICKDWCNRNGVEIVKIFKDEGISGANLNRKGLTDAIDYLEKENLKYTKIKYFVCTDASRISRSDELIDTLDVDSRIRGSMVDIIYVLQPIDTSTDEGMLIKYIQYVYANYERKKIAKRTINAIRGRLLQGYRPFGSVPLGYQRIGTGKNRDIVIDEEHGKHISKALTNYANGVFTNKNQVLEYLVSTGTKKTSRNTGKVYDSYIEQFFDPVTLYFYAGYIIYPKWDVNEPIDGKHKKLIDLESLYKIIKKEQLQKKGKYIDVKEARQDFDERFPLRGLVACKCCGRKFTGRASKSKSGKYFYYYGCQNRNCTDKPNIGVDKLHSDILDFLDDLRPTPEVWNLFKLYLDKALEDRRELVSNMIVQKEFKLNEIKNQLTEIEKSLIRITNYDLIKKLEEKRALLNEERNQITDQINTSNYIEDFGENLYEKVKIIFENPVAIWEIGNHELRHLLLGVRTGGIIYYKKNSGVRTPENCLFYRLFKAIDYP